MPSLKTFTDHGVCLHTIPADETRQAQGDCPFCGKRDHFYINQTSFLWDCKKCGEKGNAVSFLESVHAMHLDTTTTDDYKRLRKVRRNAVGSLWLEKMQLAWDGEQWLIPIKATTGRLCDIRTYKEGGRVISTTGMHVGLWGIEELQKKENAKKDVWILEGEHDGIACRELVEKAKLPVVVVAVPGATTFKAEWVPFMHGRNVVMGYDADDAGDKGMLKYGYGDKVKQTEGILKSCTKSLQFVRWPMSVDEGFDFSDLRAKHGDDTLDVWRKLFAAAPRTEVLPEKATHKLNGRVTKKGKKSNSKTASFEEVIRVYREWMELPAESVMALRVIFAVVMSIKMSGDPLWVYIVAPPGSGKTALLNPLRSVPERCVFRSSLQPHELVSGYQANTDPSLLPKLFGLCLVLKDLTEILNQPQHIQEQVFGVMTGAYDGFVERSYGNAVYRKYEGRFSMVAGVTVQIHGHSRANIGERMLKFQLIPYAKRDHEAQIRAAMENTGIEDQMDEALFDVTARFFENEVDLDACRKKIPEWVTNRIVSISQIVAKLRVQVERDMRGETVKYKPQEEVASRLGKQLKKLAITLIPTSKTGEFTEEDWKVVERTAFDTATGWNLDVVQAIMDINGGEKPVTAKELIERSGLPRSNVSRRLEDLMILKAVKKEIREKASRNEDRVTYVLSPDIVRLWKQSEIKLNHVRRVVIVRKSRKYRLKPRRK